jgi:hypothetical protein
MIGATGPFVISIVDTEVSRRWQPMEVRDRIEQGTPNPSAVHFGLLGVVRHHPVSRAPP